MLDLDKELGLAPSKAAGVSPPASGFDLDKELGVAPPGAPVVGGLRAAAAQMVGQTIKGAGQVAADFIPGVTENNGLRRYGQEMVEANPTKVQSLAGIAEDPLTAVTEAAGNAAPSMAGIVGLRAAGQGITALAPFAGPAAPVVAGVGQAVSWGGPLVLAALPSYGGVADTQKEEGRTDNTVGDKLFRAGGSLTVGGLELAGGPQARLIKAMTGGLKREAGEGLVKAIGKEALKSGVEEAGEELIQNPIEQLASYQNPTDAKNIEDTLFGGAMGFIGGGVLGGGMQAIGGQKDLAEKDPVKETTEAVQTRTLSEITGVPAATVKNGQAYLSVGEGEFITAPVTEITKHFLNGGTLENFDTAMATKDSLDKLAAELDDPNKTLDLAYLTNLRNRDGGLIQAGVNRKDIDALILSRVQETPGRKEYIAQLLASGKPDPAAVKEIATGEIDTPNAPLQAEWNRQQTLAAATNRRALQRLQETEQRIKSDQELISYWQSIGAIESPEEGKAKIKEWEDAIAGDPTTSLMEKQALMRNRYALQRLNDLDENKRKAVEMKTAMEDYEQNIQVPGQGQLPGDQGQPTAVGTEVGPTPQAQNDAPLLAQNNQELTQLAAPAGTPPSEMASPSLSAQPSPAGAAPLSVSQVAQNEAQTGLSLTGETETLNALAPWDVGPVQSREEVEAVTQAAAPGVKYDGATLDLHGFTITLPDGRQPSFSVKGAVTPETLSKAVNEVKGRFESLDNLSTRRDFLKRGGALVAWAAAGGDVTQLMASSNDFASQAIAKDQTVSGLLKWVQANSGSEKFKTLAKDLQALIPNNRTILLNTEESNPGIMGTATVDRKGRTITISLNGGKLEEATFLHEAIHAAVMARYDSLGNYLANKGALSSKNADPVLTQYQQVWVEFRDAVKAYAKEQGQPVSALPQWMREPFTKPDEFMTYALTNESLQEFMASRTYEGKTLWAKLKDFIRSLIIKATNGEPSWLDAALMTSNDVLQAMTQDQPNFDAASQVLALSTQGSLQSLFATRESSYQYRQLTKDEVPERTQVAYKLMRVFPSEPGRLFPLYARPEDGGKQGFSLGKWYKAENQRPSIGGRKLADRAGIHAVDLPIFSQGKAKVKGEKRVWVEVFMPAMDPKTQAESDTTPLLKNGQRQGISERLIGPKEAYNYRTNPSATGAGAWPIAGSMSPVRVLSDSEVTSILKANGADEHISNSLTGTDEGAADKFAQQAKVDVLWAEAPATLFSLADTSIKTAQKTVTQKVKDFAADKTLDSAPRWLSVAPLHTLVQTLGKKIPQIRKLAMHLEESEYISNDLINQAYDYYKKAGGFGTKVVDSVNRAAGTASFYRMNPMEPMLAQEWVPADKATKDEQLQVAQQKWEAAGMDKSTGKTFIAAYTEARNAYTAINNKEAKGMYGSMVNFMSTVREREKNNLLAYIEQSTVGNQSLREQLMQRFNATFKNITGAYWPLNRIGDFRLEFTDIDGTRVVKHYESAGARRADKEMYAKNGVTEFMESKKDRRPRGEVAIPMELMQQLSASVYNQKMSEADPNNPSAIAEAQAEAQDVVDEMNQIWLRWQPETSALKNSVQRRNVKGFDENMMLSFLDYTRKHAANIAWSEQGRKIEGTIKSLADEISAQRKEGQDVTFKGTVLVDLRNRLQAIRDAKTGPIASTIGKLGTAYYMTSPSIALVQMTQLPILTFPKLAVKYKSVGKAASALMRGTQAAFSKDFTKKAIFGDIVVNTLHDQLRETVNEDNRELPAAKDKMLGDRLYDDAYIEREFNKLTPKQQKLFVLREALARNLLDISAAHEAYALTQGKNPNGLIDKAFNLAMQPMKLSEMTSRKATILATMELAQGEKKSFKSIMNNVSEVVNDTLYSYSKANKPAVLQGGTARVLAMFQWYRIMTALRIGMLFKNSIAAETPEIKAAARKEFIGVMGMTTMLAGTMGLPLAKMVFAALDALADDDEPRDSELEFRRWAAERLGPQWGEVFTHGLPTLAGVNISKRVGLGDLYGAQSEPPPRLHGKELAMWWAANQLGPAFGIVQGGFQGYDLMSKGEYLKGLEASMPKPLRDGLKAARTMEEGDVKTITGRRTLGEDEMTADAIPLMALGFNPSEVAAAAKDSMSKARLSTAISERRGRIIGTMVKAIQGEGDINEAREMLIAYNKKMPRFAVRGGDIRSALVRGIKEDLGVDSKRDRLISMQYGL